MCGIAGIIVDSNQVLGTGGARLALTQLLSIETRGNHAFGYMTDRGSFYKQPGAISEFAQKKENITKIIDDFKDARIMLGHTRFATTGDKEVNDNNHPFELDVFVFAHNGCIPNHDYLLEKYCVDKGTIETDSFGMFAGIITEAKANGVDEAKTLVERRKIMADAIKALCEQTRSFSCWLFDRSTKDTYFFRDSNPLALWAKDGYVLFASEDKNIETAIEALGLAKKDYTTYIMESGKIYRSNGDTGGIPWVAATFDTQSYYQVSTLHSKVEPKTTVIRDQSFDTMHNMGCGYEIHSGYGGNDKFVSRIPLLPDVSKERQYLPEEAEMICTLLGWEAALEYDDEGVTLSVSNDKNFYGDTFDEVSWVDAVNDGQAYIIKGVDEIQNAMSDLEFFYSARNDAPSIEELMCMGFKDEDALEASIIRKEQLKDEENGNTTGSD